MHRRHPTRPMLRSTQPDDRVPAMRSAVLVLGLVAGLFTLLVLVLIDHYSH